MKKTTNELNLVFIIIGIGINISLGSISSVLKVPIYLDAVGTIIVTILLGLRAGIVTGVSSFILMTVTGLGPYYIYFSGTQVAISLMTYWLSSLGLFSTVLRVILSGVVLGIVAAVVSAPVIVYLFGGAETNGPGLITTFLIATGKTIAQSVLLKGISIEPIDKTLQCLLAIFLIKSLPKSQIRKFSNKLIDKNFENDKSV